VEKPLIKFRVHNEENLELRMRKNRNFNKYGLKAAFKNMGSFWCNPAAYFFIAKMTLLKIVLLLPDRILIRLLKVIRR
jgi:hypothetical protein